MNKKTMVALVALTYCFSFSQGEAMKYGVRAGFVMNSFDTGNSRQNEDYTMGLGFGVGIVVSQPVTDIITFNPEASFLYRTLFNQSEEDVDVSGDLQETSVTEFAISLSLMFQVMPIAGTPIHFAGGLQLDLPISTKEKQDYTPPRGRTTSDTDKLKERATLDYSLSLGAGYRVMPNIGVDAKAVIGLGPLTSKKHDDSSFNQYGAGVSYFF